MSAGRHAAPRPRVLPLLAVALVPVGLYAGLLAAVILRDAGVL